MRTLLLTATLSASVLATGCGSSGTGLYRRTGTVTFAGKPVPLGTVYFDPDVSTGASGPSGFADIVDGKYDTNNGKGSIGGPMIVRVTGYSDENRDKISGFGPPLFAEHHMKAELPAATSELNIEVPASAANGLPKQTAPLDP
jgi:hypothetical protein